MPNYRFSLGQGTTPYCVYMGTYFSTTQAYSFTPSDLSKGKHVGYSEVIETLQDKDGNEIGYTVYKYTSAYDYPDLAPTNFDSALQNELGIRNFQDNKRGHLVSETVHLKDRTIISEKKFEYTTKRRAGKKSKYLRILPKVNPNNNGTAMVYCIVDYFLDNDSFLCREMKTTTYDPTGKKLVTEETHYDYNEMDLIKEERFTQSNGVEIKTEYKYPSDYNTNPYTKMLDANVLNPIVEKWIYHDNTFIKKQITEYMEIDTDRFLISTIKTQQKNQPAPETKVRYAKYDLYGNPAHVILNESENIVYMWSNGQYPYAELKNATAEEVEQYTSIDSYRGNNVLMDKVDQLRTLLPHAMVTTYLYKTLVGPVHMTDPQGLNTYYEYDSLHRLKAIKDHEGKTIQSFDYNYKGEEYK